MPERQLRRLSTPRAAAAAGVLFALLFGAALILIRLAIPGEVASTTEWTTRGGDYIKIAATMMPFAGIAFLWFIGVVRDGFGGFEDRFFSTVFIGSGLLFLAMIFVAFGVVAGLEAGDSLIVDPGAHLEVGIFAQHVLLTVSKTYAVRMAAVFMISLATIWLKTGLMPRWLVGVTYLVAVGLLLAGELSMWLTLAFPVWVLTVSVLLLTRGEAQRG